MAVMDKTKELSTEFDRLRHRLGTLAEPASGADGDLRQHALGLATLFEVSSSLVESLDLERTLQATTDGMVRLSEFDTAAVYLLEGETLRLGATTPPLPPGFPEHLRRAPLADHPHVRMALSSRSPIHVADITKAELSSAEQAVTEQRGLRTLLYVPLVAGADPVGALIVGSVGSPREISEVGLELCSALANLAALAAQNARLFEAGRRHAQALEHEIAERKRSEAERMELERRLLHSQKLESLGVLAGGIAHDFNNLLQAIVGNLDVSLAALPPGSPGREDVEAAALAARRANDLTRQLLAYSGKGRFAIQAVDLGALVRENAALLRTSVSRTVALELELAPSLPPIEADPGQIQQVVMNLITNASEAIGAAPGTITLSTGLRRPAPEELSRTRAGRPPEAKEFVELVVSDDGCGMDGSTLERLFDPFFTTKKAGRGLGMSALLGIVRGHHGALFVDSTQGQGTKVRALFPVMEGARAAAAAAPEPSPKAAPCCRAVLVVDDEELVRSVGKAMLRALKVQAFVASGGREALEIVRAHPGEIGTVLLDLTMPDMDGIATLLALRELDPGLRVLLSSGYDEDESMRRLPSDVEVGFLHKPYTLAGLREAVAG